MQNPRAAIMIVVIIGALLSALCSREPTQIKIGAILPLTGDAAKYGEAAKRGIDLAVDEINTRNGVRGKKIAVVYEDDQADPRTGVSALQKLIRIDRVKAVLGPMASSVTLAVAPVAEKNEVVILSPVSSAPAITDAGDYIFRNVASDLFEGEALAAFAADELKIKTAAILFINNDYGVGLKDSFGERFRLLGGETTAMEAFDQGATDFRTQLVKVSGAKPQAICVIGYKEVGRILRQAAELGIQTQFLSFAMFEDPEILEIAGEAANGVFYSFRAYDPKAGKDVVTHFVESFVSRYGSEPDIFAALSYDAARILALAMQNGGFDGPEIRSALYDIKDFPGVAGTVSFDTNGDVIGTISIKTVSKGEFSWFMREYSM